MIGLPQHSINLTTHKYGNSVYRVIEAHSSQAAFISDETKFELFVAGLVFEDTYDANTTYQPGDIAFLVVILT